MNPLQRIRWTFVAVATLCFTPWLGAQTPTNLPAAVERAILQNPEVKLRFHNLVAAAEEKKVGEGAWRPRIDLEVGTGGYQTLSPSLGSSVNYAGNRASIQLRQVLFDGLGTRNEVRRLSYAQQAAYFELRSISDQTALEATRAYVDALRYRDLVSLAQDNFNTHLQVHDRLAQKVKAGVGRRVDLEQASGRLALAESNWLTEVSNLHDVSARYQRIVGELPAENLARLDPVSAFLPLGTEFLSEAVIKNPDFLGAVANLRAYRADLDSKRSVNSPTVEFRARQSFETNQSGVMGDYRDTALELVLNYNLYRGNADSARIKQYAAKLDSAYDLRDKACRDIWQTGQIAFNDSVRLGNQIKLLTQHELSTSKATQAYKQQFEIGQRSLLDLLDTENELYQARRALSNAEYDLQLAEIRVLAVSGTLLSALKLTPLSSIAPPAEGGTENDDGLALCSNRIVPTLTLDRTVTNQVEEPIPTPVAVAPAPPPQPVAPLPPAPPVKLNFAADAFFDFGQTTLKEDGKKALDALLPKLKEPGLQSVLITGHTDGMGPDAVNQLVSEARAAAVGSYLESQGIPHDKLQTLGKGKTQPIAGNDTREGRAKNRRVEIAVTATRPAP